MIDVLVHGILGHYKRTKRPSTLNQMSLQSFKIPEIPEADDEHVTKDKNDHVITSSATSDIGETHTQVTEVDEESWDTDLEVDEADKDHDLTGRSQYRQICEELGVIPIKYFLRHLTEHSLEMRFHGIGPSGAKAMALILRDSVTLEHLDLQGNSLKVEGGHSMARMLNENNYVTEVNLADNCLGTEGAAYICDMLERNSGLKKLDISANELGDSVLQPFVRVLEINKNLKELILSRNSFGDCGGQILGPAIGSNDTLDVIDLSWNHLRQKGALAIAKGIQENVHLKKCVLSWNGFGSNGGGAIAEAMMVNSSILELNIAGNRLDQQVATKMAKALRNNDEIRILRMGNNAITTSGAITLVDAVNSNPSSSLNLLDLTDVEVEFEFLKIVKQIQTSRPDFTVIHGPLLRAGNTREDMGKPGIDINKQREPVEVYRDQIVVNDKRFVDILKKYDPNDSLSVTPEEFIIALGELGVPYDKEKVKGAVDKLTDTNTGVVYFGDFIRHSGGQTDTP